MTSSTAGSKRIGNAFAAAAADGRICFVPYVVAGFPDQDASAVAAIAALDAGADLLEIGLPYSDPLADGVTLQRASAAALAGGQSLDASLDLVERVAKARPDKPLLVMGYVNQFLGPRGADCAGTGGRVLSLDERMVIAGACRTPIGSFGGALKDQSAADLGEMVGN